jgi:hypothetical protein
MRWFWRADPATLLLDGLLEGSLVGALYFALATTGSNPTAPLSFPVFWLAAAAGLFAARLPPGQWRDLFSVPALAVVAGLAGWLLEPAARGALIARASPVDLLAIHPAGWLLAVAVLRGAVHSDTQRENDISTDAITFSIPLLALALMLYLGTGHAIAALAPIGVGICIVAGMLSIGLARVREFETTGTAGEGTRVWPAISSGIVVLAAIGIPIALVVGTVAQEPILAFLRWFAGALVFAATAFQAWIESLITQLLHMFSTSPAASPHPTPTAAPQASDGPRSPYTGNPGPVPWWADVMGRVLLIGVGVVALVVLQLLARRWRPGLRARPTAHAVRQERHRGPVLARLHVSLPGRSFRPRLPFRRRPVSAVGAYIALLGELANRGELARGPAETPRSHARRVGHEGLAPEQLPLALLAADYQLAIYGQVPISDRETARAIERWQRLRKLARRTSAHPPR